jgi:hypothetical protein
MYFLSKDCFVCRAQSYWVVLNASRDRYSCVTDADLTTISGRLHGWRHQGDAADSFSPFGVEADTLIESLMSHGIITVNSDDGKPFAESECSVCEKAMELHAPNARVKHPLTRVARFFIACTRIDWQLRKKELSRTLTRIERRRILAQSSTAIHDIAHVSGLIASFKDLRPLYPRRYLCLFDSLALLEYLAGYRCFPRVVFGVVADPFQAHCWLQEGKVVINDDLERISKYKPILSL